MNNEEEPEITQWITPFVRHPIKLPEEMLTEDEVKRMIQAADHPRDKALIAIFWDSGGRTGELGNLRLKHIVFDQYGAVAVVDGKTGMRRVRLIFSVPYLAAWIDIHPFKDKPDAHLWVGIGRRGRNKPLKYDAIRMIFKRVAKNAGISKDIYNHLLRHSRSTDLAQYLTESQMKEHLGWKQDSKMPAIYVHLSGKQIDDAMLRIHGIVKQEDNKPQLSTVNCPRCKHVNGTVSNFCARCGMALNVQTALDMDQEKSEMLLKLMSLMEGDPELRNLFKEA
ncbi:hypothetical protein EO94_17920 [Methanosarcina sp. 2.H.T.1A.3]|uniref:site-specific integrase n=1 Tax=Methanosarcina sp. 2.H.T.1A.3 TaxID=1483597 RepID=UPI0006216C7F|nr:site-specific integrase [Methanosarcina sp. 2.H.T.1A.3]KKG13749.1 hypothetical protein EO94_17920 [Methanosarcina sp. 2.H.T.1A.3]